jgi:hypothetical protein
MSQRACSHLNPRRARALWQLSVILLGLLAMGLTAHATVLEHVRELGFARASYQRTMLARIASLVLRDIRFQPPRVRVIQRLLDTTEGRKYLEIGVDKGKSILPINAETKIGVDPGFRLSPLQMLKYPLRTRATRLYRVESDRFFQELAPEVLREPADVIFIDGLHTHQQSLRDLTNALVYLRDGGWIVMHDGNPPHHAAAFPAQSYEQAVAAHLPGWDRAWCGDVWKTVVHARATARDLEVCVLDTDFGLALFRQGTPRSRLALTPDQILGMTYEDLAQNRQELLNLKPPGYLDELLGP